MTPEDDPPTYAVRLLERHEVAERTFAFHFEKPAGYRFVPGQFNDLTIPSPAGTDGSANTHAFSIASAPHEPFLMVATRIRDTAFKRNLMSLPLGSEVTIKGPFGDFVLDRDGSRPVVILTGGVGITPFRSMIVDWVHHWEHLRSPKRIWLFYSNRRPEDAVFLGELEKLVGTHRTVTSGIGSLPEFQLVATMTDMAESGRPWHGEVGKIDAEMIARHAPSKEAPIYYVAGPPAMVNGLHEVLVRTGVSESSIRTEQFDGY
ncbi:MAG: FAD-dependent oxidoreductase [Thermoplasmata archaeon]|nr:FAD-dependent oxidoreductase [Thermoplasmata archaeon]